jgi:hypothetical protein
VITDSVNQPRFAEAITDYYFLLNKGYPKKGILKIVGDRYNLTGSLRTILQRGVWSKSENISRALRLTNNIANQELVIDGYNVVLTLLNYKMGRPVFVSTDSFCRDAGSLFGKIRNQKTFSEIVIQIIDFLSEVNQPYFQIFLDTPVSYSAEHAMLTENLIEKKKLMGSVHLVKSADNAIKELNSGIICTSDSNIIDSTQNPICDLAFLALQQYYTPELLDIRKLIEL